MDSIARIHVAYALRKQQVPIREIAQEIGRHRATVYRRFRRIRAAGLEVSSVAFSSDGGLLASSSASYDVLLWRAAAGTPAGRLIGHGGTMNSLAFSPDGTLLASAGYDGTIRLWGLPRP